MEAKNVNSGEQKMSYFQELPEICRHLGLGELMKWALLRKNFSLSTLLQLQTTSGKFLVKSYTVQKKNQLKSSINIKKIFTGEENSLGEWGGILWLASLWHEGKTHKPCEITPRQIKQVAKMLAEIHKSQCAIAEVFPVLSTRPAQLKSKTFQYFYQCFKKSEKLLAENLVISHGDVLPENVIWGRKPLLIDWDNAGYINQDIELFNAAINFAGIESNDFNIAHYRHFIESYAEVYPRVISINEVTLCASFGSWLDWWAKTKDERVPQVLRFLLKGKRLLFFEEGSDFVFSSVIV